MGYLKVPSGTVNSSINPLVLSFQIQALQLLIYAI